MAALTEKRHAAGFMISEAPGYRSRRKVIVTAENLGAGTVLGRVLASAATAVFTGTGNGALTMDATTPLLAGVQEGVYRAICVEPGTNVGTFAVYDPKGILLGTHVVAGTAFSNQIKFAIADGSTDFVAGDRFDIYVRAGTISAGSNTGNGTATLYQTMEGVQTGTYTLACTAAASNAGTFSVTAPDGTALANLTVATRYTNAGLDLLIADGGTDFIVGDTFTIAVTRGKVKGWDPSNTDGSGAVYGILWDAVDASSADKLGTAIVADAEVNFAELAWDSDVDASEKETARAALAGLGIICR
jgi:hypothetical protein